MASEKKTLDVGLSPGDEDRSQKTDTGDVEGQADHGAGTTVHLQRRLQSRHLQMIAIGKLDRYKSPHPSATENHAHAAEDSSAELAQEGLSALGSS